MASQHTILVPVTHNQASIEAVTVACQLARQRKSKVLAVHVIEVLRSLPLNAEMEVEARRGEQLLRKAEEAATHSGYHVSGQLLQAREAGQAIVDEARDQNADVIVMGIGYKRLIGAFQVGRTVDFVLKNASCQVWVVRQAVSTAAHNHGEGPGHGHG